MGAFGVGLPIYRQPVYSSRLIKHGIGDKLELAINGAYRHPYDLVKGVPITYGSTSWATDSTGGYRKSGVTGTAIASTAMWNNTGEASALILFRRNVPYNASGTGWRFTTSLNDSYTSTNVMDVKSFWTNTWAIINFPSPPTNIFLVIMTVKDGQQRFYCNGALLGSGSGTGGFSFPSTDVNFCYENFNLYAGFAWSRALSANEVGSLSANPWQLFEPVTRNIWTTLPSQPTGKAPLYLNRDSGSIASAFLNDKIYNSIVPYDVSPGYGSTYITFANSSEGYVDVAAGLQPINPTKVKVWVDPTDTSSAEAAVTYETSYAGELDWGGNSPVKPTLKKFDPRLGTLTSIKFGYALFLRFEGDITNTGLEASVYMVDTSFDFNVNSVFGTLFDGIANIYELSIAVGQFQPFDYNETSSDEYIFSPSPSYIGTDQVITLNTTTTTSATLAGDDFDGGVISSLRVVYNITYSYIPATGPKTANDHRYLPLFAKFTVAANPNGNGFRIYGRSKEKLNGTFKLRYSYS